MEGGIATSIHWSRALRANWTIDMVTRFKFKDVRWGLQKLKVNSRTCWYTCVINALVIFEKNQK